MESKVEAVSVYKDTSGLFTTQPVRKKIDFFPSLVRKLNTTFQLEEELPSSSSSSLGPAASSSSSSLPFEASSAEVEDEDALLYGDAPKPKQQQPQPPPPPQQQQQQFYRAREPAWRRHLHRVDPTFWAALLLSDGSLEILSLPDFVVRFHVGDFSMALDVLADLAPSQPPLDSSMKVRTFPIQRIQQLFILLSLSLGPFCD